MTTPLIDGHPVDIAASVIERITAITPMLRENGIRGEADRSVPQESVDALIDAGAFRVSTPLEYGGYGLGHLDAMRVARAVGYADGGTGWILSLINSGAAYMQNYSTEAQDEIFASGPDTLISVVVTATGTARRVDGGWRISGKWFYNSGSAFATWALVAVTFEDENGHVIGDGQVAVSTADATIEDVWFVAGMRSTASNCLVIDDVFVPDHRALLPVDPETLPYKAVSVPLAILGPQMGIGRAALDHVIAKAESKSVAFTTLSRQTDSITFQLMIAKAALKLDTADLHAERAGRDLDSAVAAGERLDYRTRARVRADIGWAADNVSQAIEILLTAQGAASFADSNPLQRMWRDQAVVARHGYVNPPLGYEVYGKALLDVDDHISTVL
ncbi:MAG: acyl-CoA dehydrogenase family protein [Pseudoclavibacter sp.]